MSTVREQDHEYEVLICSCFAVVNSTDTIAAPADVVVEKQECWGCFVEYSSS